MIRYNNWMTYSYDGIENGLKKIDSSFSIKFKADKEPLDISYKDALFRNASIMRDQYTEPFDVCLSGGIDSEVVVRTFKDLGIKHNTFIFRLEDSINAIDVSNAITLCNALNIDYKIIDFNLRKFFENDALHYAEIIKTPRAGRLPRLMWFEMLDNIVITGEGEPYWTRDLATEETKSSWSFHFSEDAYTNSRYTDIISKTAICDWYEYTPEIMWSFKKIPLIENLLKDNLPNKLSTWSSRHIIHKEIWPDIKYIPKLTGFEGYGNPGSMPDFMNDFQNIVLSKYTSKDILLNEEEFKLCLTSPQEF